MHIIGLHGPARAGKDTIADFLVESYGFIKFAFSDALYKEVAEAFSLYDERILRDEKTKDTPLNQMALSNCRDGAFVELALEQSISDNGVPLRLHAYPKWAALSPRRILQVWGTEYRRAQNPDYWVEKADLWMQAFIETLSFKVTKDDVDSGHVAKGTPVGATLYYDHPGVAISGVRFLNERAFISRWSGVLWHVRRSSLSKIDGVSRHVSEQELPFHTGDKMILNYSTIPHLYTGVSLLLQGNGIVNTADVNDEEVNS